MKYKLITLAVFATLPVAQAAVTVTPMLGYDFMSDAHGNQRDALVTNAAATGGLAAGTGIAQESDIIEAIAAGVELTKNVDFELEYQQIQTMARKNKASIPQGYFDSREQNYNGNFLIYNSLFGLASTKLRPYALVGAGHSNIEAKDDALSGLPGRVVVASSDDTIANLGMGAKYHFNRNIAFRGEGRLTYNTDNSWLEPMLLAGIQWRLGAKAPAQAVAAYVAPAPVVVTPPVLLDTDKDGVFDQDDQCPNTPMSYAVDNVGCPIELLEDAQIPLNVMFDTNKSIVKPAYFNEIAQVANFMNKYPETTTVIEGHTDIRGSRALNTRLSQDRADAVKVILVQQFGIAASRLSAVGYGPDRPIAANDSAANMQKNRRTVALVKAKARKVELR